MIRKKSKIGIIDHICKLKMTDEYLLIGSSHVERLVWKFPHLAPSNTWLCGIGGDGALQMSLRVHNENGCGYTQHRNVQNKFKSILLLIGGNDMLSEKMSNEEILVIVKHVDNAYQHLTKRWPHAKVQVLPILPVPDSGKRNKDNFGRYNKFLVMSGMVKCDISFVWDLDPENDFEDDVHLNESGYKNFLRQSD